MKMTNEQFDQLKKIYNQRFQFFGQGNFYQSFPLLELGGTRDTLKRIEKGYEILHETEYVDDCKRKIIMTK